MIKTLKTRVNKRVVFKLRKFNSGQNLKKMLVLLRRNAVKKIVINEKKILVKHQNIILDLFESSKISDKSLAVDKFFKGFLSYLCWNLSNKRPKDVYDRMLRISTKFVGYRFRVYNGRVHRLLVVTTNHIGFRFGEFAFTRKFGLGSELHMRRKKKTK